MGIRFSGILCLVVVWVCGSGCGAREPNPLPPGIRVAVSILPQKYFVERIGGEAVSVTVLVGPGESPEVYSPRPSQLREVERASVYFTIGVPFEGPWLARVMSANPELNLVDTTVGVSLLSLHDHEHGEHGHMDEKTADPHIWLSPRRVGIQARTICEALCRIDPSREPVFRANLQSFLEDIGRLDEELRERLGALPRRSFMVVHPSWGYFAEDYGLEMIPIEVGGQEPSAAELAAFIRLAGEKKIRAIIAQPEFSLRSPKIVAQEIGAEVVPISPLSDSWLENLRLMGETLEGVLGDEELL
jgi:zinc transport system substrate-binding protein